MSGLSWRERLRRMNQRSLFTPSGRAGAVPLDDPEGLPPPAQTRAEAMQRLQVGAFGIGAMLLLVGLASIIGGQAERNDQLAVPEAAPTTEPAKNGPGAQANPLADAGVVPDIAAQPSPSPSPRPLDLPPPPGQPRPQGNVAPAP